jgi:hypothetical protein
MDAVSPPSLLAPSGTRSTPARRAWPGGTAAVACSGAGRELGVSGLGRAADLDLQRSRPGGLARRSRTPSSRSRSNGSRIEIKGEVAVRFVDGRGVHPGCCAPVPQLSPFTSHLPPSRLSLCSPPPAFTPPFPHLLPSQPLAADPTAGCSAATQGAVFSRRVDAGAGVPLARPSPFLGPRDRSGAYLQKRSLIARSRPSTRRSNGRGNPATWTASLASVLARNRR